MDDLFDFGPDLLSNRALFQAAIEEAYSTPGTSMQLDDFSSHGTSSPGADTPPSSSGDQEEALSPDESHEARFLTEGAFMTQILAGMGGPTVMRVETNAYDDSFQDPLLDVSSPLQPYSARHSQSSVPAYIWESRPGDRPVYPTTQGNYLAFTYPTSSLLTGPAAAWDTPTQATFEHHSPTPSFAMHPSAIPRIRNPTTGTDRGHVNQESMSLRSLQSDAVMERYSELSSNVAMNNMGYDLSTGPPNTSGVPPTTQSRVTEIQQAQMPMVRSNQPYSNGEQAIPHRLRYSEDTAQGQSEQIHVDTTMDDTFRADESASERNDAFPMTQARNVGQSRLPVPGNSNRHPVGPKRTRPSASARSVVPYGPPSPPSHSEKKGGNKGGRIGGLNGDTRAHANQMRKLGACWICAFQRDQCDAGSPCTRCQDRSIRGSQHVLPCSRMHLQELVQRFLPATMNRQHRRDATITFARDNLGFWRNNAPITVYLTCHGFGHFTWELHEFEPSSRDLLLQRRYQLGTDRTWQWREKRSPPLALKEISFTQSHKLDAYVDSIIDEHLEEFQKDAYSEEEESCAMFQTEVLKALCSLYSSLPEEEDDKNLKGDLRMVLRMMVLTCIMDHPIALSATHQDTAISMMQSHNDPRAYNDWTSPVMANRQLKYYFSEMQTQQYNRCLNRLHQILRGAKDKTKLWMSSFVLMIGIALVLEQCQHLLWLKADHKMAKGEITPTDAAWEARGHCAEIDDGFDFLNKLYHCKYRGKHRQKTRFEEWKNKTSNEAEADFANTIYDIVDRNGGYLLHRQNLKISGMSENNYFSRLIARFLVNLMGLDQSSP